MSSAVDNVADNVASVNINETPNGTAPATAQGTDAAAASADEGRRLYIGNLAYATTEGELKEFFKDYKIDSTSIPVNPRTNRPVGYAFVDLSTAHEATSAIEQLSGKEILQRKVSVQLARKPEPAEAKAEGTSGGESGEGRKRTRGRGRFGGRGRGRGGRFGRQSRAQREGQEGQDKTEASANVPGQAAPLTEIPNENNIAAAVDSPKQPGKSRGRTQKQRGPPEDGIPSKTKVMVANLPYDLTEDKLKEIFAAYEPVSAKIALRPIPRFMIRKLLARNERRKGRGFGFVTLAAEALQQKAVSEMNGKEIEGREIAVKVAIDSPGKEDEAPGAEEQETAAAPADENTAPTPASEGA